MCVFFDEDRISGLELLERSGLPIVGDRSTLGTAVCKLGGRGCASGDCFCRYPVFWGYWVRDPDQKSWNFSDVGANDRVVRDGAVDGWSWGKDGKPPPPKTSFAHACGARTASASRARAARPLVSGPRTSRPNYVPFFGFLALFAALGAAMYVRRARSG
jgi:hypothetical protein